MSDLSRATRKARRNLGASSTIALIGRHDGLIYDGDLMYVRPLLADVGERPAVKLPLARGAQVIDTYGLAVRLGYDSTGQRVILGMDENGLKVQGLSRQLTNPLSKLNKYVAKPFLQPLRVRRSQDPAKPLFAEVLPDLFVIGGLAHWWTGGDIDLSGEIPSSGNWRYTVVFYNLGSDALEIYSSTEQAVTSTLGVSDVQEALDANPDPDSLPLRAFRMTHSMTTLDDNQENSPDIRTVVNAGGGYELVLDNGTPLARRRKLNFIAGTDITLTIADNPIDHRTDVTIDATGGVTPGDDIEAGKLTVDKSLYFTGKITPSALTGNINDYNPTGLADASTIYQDLSGGNWVITGLAGGADGREITLFNISATLTLQLYHDSSGSADANCFYLPDGITLYQIPPLAGVALRYDVAVSRWFIKASSANLHINLADVGANDHHAQSHAHNGADGSGSVAGTDLTGASANTVLGKLGAAALSWLTAANLKTLLALVAADVSDFTTAVNSLITTALSPYLTSATAASTYIANASVDAKGDLIVGTADDTPARLPIGANGTEPIADGTQTTGVLWDMRNLAIPGGRITLASGTPVPSSDQTAKTTIYYTPFLHNMLPLYDTTKSLWLNYASAEISVAVPSTLFKVFDLFAYSNSGTPALETLDWNQTTGTITAASNASPIVITSNGHGLNNGDIVGIAGIGGNTAANGKQWIVANKATNTFELRCSTGNGAFSSNGTWYKIPNTRATALAQQDGRWVKSGDATRLWVGTLMTTGVSGQCEDSETKRFVWNRYNQVGRSVHIYPASIHAYTTGAFRAWNNDGDGSRAGIVLGDTQAFMVGGSAQLQRGSDAINVDANDGSAIYTAQADGPAAATYQAVGQSGRVSLTAGYHPIYKVEYGVASANFSNSELSVVVQM